MLTCRINFTLKRDESTFVDWQKVKVQESADEVSKLSGRIAPRWLKHRQIAALQHEARPACWLMPAPLLELPTT